MMSGPRTRLATPLATLATELSRHTLRLRLKPKAPATGHVDGAWWPRSRDLSVELPELLVVLAVRLGHVVRVTYNLDAWHPTARHLIAQGGVVRLEGFRSQPADIVTVIGTDRQRLTLLVVPPNTSPANAHHTMMTASSRGNRDSLEGLLAAAPTGSAADTQRWEADGGWTST
ncbi:DUF5994 family protein [Actinocrispum wychmicini]|uniref:Uncharacterized protein n=1 Tax=Actinocrispum wychmicini TaxID=1213861 RepID=A0A4R2J5R7_9PSEU|nr:DUF5994 family protein [Actinocrispum wychmicini]TCO54253.1 hypothetical protein EV192_109233 [Actinocrispum wychmicini]